MLRQLPPTAVPLTWADLRLGLNPPANAQAEFGAVLAQHLGVPTCHLASSGRTALYVLLQTLSGAADHPARKEVLLPAYTCPALVKVALDLELQPRLVDISPRTLAIREDHLVACLGEQTLAVICVHPFGIPHVIEDILALAHANGAVVIEDACQAMGARLAGQPVGTQGDFGLFSLGPGKPLSTGGGGVLAINNSHYTRLVEQSWAALAQPSTLAAWWTQIRMALFGLAFHPTGWWLATRVGLHRVGNYETSWGYTLSKLSAAQAAVGLALFGSLDEINGQRIAHARRLSSGLQELDSIQIPLPAASAEPIYLRLPLIISGAEQRERLFRRLWAAGISAGRMYGQPLSDFFPQLAAERYPGAEYVARHLLTLPTHHYLSTADVDKIVQICIALTKLGSEAVTSPEGESGA